MPNKSRPPSGGGLPSPREAVAKVTAAAGPAVARAQAKAAPKIEKAAVRAGSLLGQLKDRAKDTARGFSEGYKPDSATSAEQPEAARPPTGQDPAQRPRPRPS